MASLYNADLKPIEAGGKTHDYSHASKLFISDNFRLAAKHTAFYYVKLNVNQQAFNSLTALIAPDSVGSQSIIEQIEAGLLARRADLPRFNIDTKTLNAYNRKNIVQNNIKYDPVSIVFHDDAANIVTNFWNDYYTFYYRDSDYSLEIYNLQHKYTSRQRDGWGYTPRLKNVINFLSSVQIYSLWKKRFTEYTLINPIITNWRHGEHDSYQNAELLTNTMTLAYETVKYRTGYINAAELPGFGTIHYDNFKSPISTSTTNIYADAGILGAIDGMSRDLARPDGTGSGRGITGQALDAYRLYNNLKNVNFKNVVGTTVGQIGLGIVNGTVNGAINAVFAPTLSGAPGYGGVYSGSQTYAQQVDAPASPFPNPVNAATTSFGSGAAALVTGTAFGVTSSSTALSAQATAATRGIAGVVQPASSYATRVFQVQESGNAIFVSQVTGQPIAGQTVSYNQAPTGGVLPSIATQGALAGGFDPANITKNQTYAVQSTDSSGNPVFTAGYRDGTVVQYTVVDGNTNILNVTPSATSGPVNNQVTTGTGYQGPAPNPAPQDARTRAASGQPVPANQSQFYTDPRTGLVYSTNGITGQITNTVAGGLGTAAGFAVGSSLQSALSRTGLGKTVPGQIISTAISTGAGAVVGGIVNNTLQPIVNKVTGTAVQFVNENTKDIVNGVRSFVGLGGYDAANPNQNIKSWRRDDETQEYVFTYYNGTTVYTDENRNVTAVIRPPSLVDQFNVGWKNTFGDAAAALPGYAASVVRGIGGNPYSANNNWVVDNSQYQQANQDYLGGPASNQYYDPTTDSFVDAATFQQTVTYVPDSTFLYNSGFNNTTPDLGE